MGHVAVGVGGGVGAGEEAVCARLASLVETNGAQEGLRGVTEAEAAAALEVPLVLVREHLRMGEARGVLCRDEGPEGRRFFRNFFPEAFGGASLEVS